MQHEGVANLPFPRGVRLVKTYYKNQEWCYFPDPITFITRYEAGDTVKLGMRNSRGRMKIATFSKDFEEEGTWADDRAPTAEEADAILIATGRRMAPPSIPTSSRRHHGSASSPSQFRRAPRGSRETQAAGPQRRKGKKEHALVPFWSPIHKLTEATAKKYGNGAEIAWFGSVAENLQRLDDGQPIKAGVMLSDGTVKIYDIINGRICRSRTPSRDEKGDVQRMLGYKQK